jgi:hypothetical protein
VEFFEFKQRFKESESPRVVCIAAWSALVGLLDEKTLEDVFGGWIKYYGPGEAAGYLGVWGARNARTLRRICREKGADVILSRSCPEGIGMHSRRCIWGEAGKGSGRRKNRPMGSRGALS